MPSDLDSKPLTMKHNMKNYLLDLNEQKKWGQKD